MNMEGMYRVDLISSDLSTEETIHEIANTLQHLNDIVEHVFSNISARVDANLTRARALQQRINTSEEKVATLSGLTRAVEVFSPSKYPATDVFKEYESPLESLQRAVDERCAGTRRSVAPEVDKDLQEKLHFYHVNVSSEPQPPARRTLGTELQRAPHAVPVGSLLVFDTAESPYVSGRAGAARGPAAAAPRAERLGAAPVSIANRERAAHHTDGYLYAPEMGAVPELEMPLDLPHLPGIAGDVHYSRAAPAAIAPSAAPAPLALPTPGLPDLHVAEGGAPEQLPPPPPPPPPVAAASPPPPPPPPPPPVQHAAVEMRAPPPPPPPPPPQATAPPGAPPPAAAPDAHSSLMAAIRATGGVGKARLRAAAAAPPDATKGAGAGGDLMSDLHAKLSMRRKFISCPPPAERRSVLESLAAAIPEPDAADSDSPGDSDAWE